jgi:Zn-dependent protease with chaperone function/uncharacterized tellurite resistance protein B-like protein
MDFFEAQDRAHRNTRWLVFWYLLILFAVSVIASLVLMLLIPMFSTGHVVISSDYLLRRVYIWDNWHIFAGVSAFVFGGAAINSWLKSRELSKGGAAIAEQLGARLVPLNTRNPLQKRALNQVQEMAIAANMPVPQLYLMAEDTSINAFAAGMYPSDAVVCITRGALERLTREQLQGVVAHEFSHILNGDMRLNLRLIVLLHGIEFIGSVGRFMSSSSRRHYRRSNNRKGGGGAAVLIGLLLRLVGWLGHIFSRILQAKISREREYLADASAVQFTRNPESIGGALKVLAYTQGRSYLSQDNLDEVAHLFFAQALARMFSWYATHPPLEERIRRIEPNWNGMGLKGLDLQEVNSHLPQDESKTGEQSEQANVDIAGIQVEELQNLAVLLPVLQAGRPLSQRQQMHGQALLESLHNPLDAMAMVLAVLMAKQLQVTHENYHGKVLVKQLLDSMSSEQQHTFGTINGLDKLLAQQLERLQSFSHINRLLLIELAMPSLKQLSEAQYQTLQTLMQGVAQFDGQLSLFETAIIGLLENYLAANLGLKPQQEGRVRRFSAFKPELQILFSYLCQEVAQSILPERDYQAAIQQLELQGMPMLDVEGFDEKSVERALSRLKRLAWQPKGKLLQVMVDLVERDGILAASEEELILVIALSLEAPLPRFSLQAQLDT